MEATPSVRRRCFEEVPRVEEVVAWHAATGAVVQIEQAGDFTAKLNGVGAVNLGGDILEAVSPLIQDAADIRSKRIWRTYTAKIINEVRREANRRLGVGADLISAPSASLHASFVEEGRREGVVPDGRKRFIDLRVMEEVVGSSPAVKKTG